MEKVINSMPTDQNVKAQKVLEINEDHPIAQKLKKIYAEDKELLKEYTKILYSQARLIEGLSIENPTEISNLVCELMAKYILRQSKKRLPFFIYKNGNILLQTTN